jgi:hypothetical protein
MRKQKFIIQLAVVLSVLCAGIYLADKLTNILSDYLSKSEPVEANILLVEGWLPDYAIMKSYEEFRKHGYDQIITTGMNSAETYFNVHSNGYLIFYTKKWFSGSDTAGHHIFEVEAYSELGGNGRAHFNVFINNSPAGSFYAETKSARYKVSWEGKLSLADSIMVEFDNDSMSESEDRNLYIKSIRADNRLVIPYLNNSVYDMFQTDSHVRSFNDIKSGAESARVRLIMAGIDSTLITAVPAPNASIHRTLASALAFSEWLKTNLIQIRGINIVSVGPHARRTWITYKKVLNAQYPVGIISVPGNPIQYSTIRLALKTIRETVGLLYYHIILIPY